MIDANWKELNYFANNDPDDIRPVHIDLAKTVMFRRELVKRQTRRWLWARYETYIATVIYFDGGGYIKVKESIQQLRIMLEMEK